MQDRSVARIVAFFVLGMAVSMPATAQHGLSITANSDAQNVPSRVVDRIDETKLVRLTGNTHPMARPQFDQGLADPQLPMERMVLVLKRSPEQEAALDQFMQEQLDPRSPNFHHWLTPEVFGKLYGPSDNDMAAITSWLESQGFQIYKVGKGRINIEFSGTAAQVQRTFHTEMHHYLVNSRMHLSNDRDPQIPAAVAPVVGGVASLNDFFPVHQSVLGRYVRRDKKTGKITPVDPVGNGQTLQYGFTDDASNNAEDITPYDFATIYNLLPLWNAGITGKGQTIAISAVTDIAATDVSTFRNTFGLGSFTGTISQVHNGTDPGIVVADQVENTLDTEWSGASAPDADVVVVVSATTQTTFGGQLSDSYIVENPSIATIMSASYGACEIGLGTAGNYAINAIYQQGSSEGISMFESSGDQGSTGCDNSDAETFPAPAQYGLQVNGDASSPWITAVGGTEFTWQDFRTTYWSATNASNGSNALGYIPEAPWNGTCTSQLLLDRLFTPDYGYTTLEQVCNNVAGLGATELIKVTGGSGGVSSCITSTNEEFSTCGGGYPQPLWQKGVTGMPGSTYRYLPDVSLFASSGFPDGINGSSYLICVASNSPDKSCDYTDNTQIVYQEVGGTSVSSPALAGIMALVQQKQSGVAQGLANPVFYALAAKDNLTNCNSSTVTNGNACNFYDVTYGNNAQVCTTGSINCVTNTTGDTYGIVSGYSTTTGYDQATGLGSVNATNLVNNWASIAGTPGFTLSASPSQVSVAQGGSNTDTITITDAGKFTGSPSLAASGLPSGVTAKFAAGTVSGTQLLTLTASTTAPVTTSPVTVTITGTSGTLTATTTIGVSVHAGTLITPTVTVTPAASSITTLQSDSVTVTVSGGSGHPTPTGSVTLTSGSYSSGAKTLSSGSVAIIVPAGSLAVGNDTLTAAYTPDSGGSATYNSASGHASVDVTQASGPCTTANPNPNPHPDSFDTVGDFNGDCKSDLVWRNGTTGEVKFWFMNGTAISSQGVVATIAPPWNIVGIGDFNGDGKSDLLWQNSSTGELEVWLMNGATKTSSGSPGTVGSPWKVAGVGDFNGDGKTDIVWRNSTTGEVKFWFMNGTAIASQGVVATIAPPWNIVGVGDFNGDGKADLLWQNSSTGELEVWLMNGITKTSSGSPGTVTSPWKIASVGDFNGDGKTDIVWRNSTTGEVKFWFMNGIAVASQGVVATIAPPWNVVGAADFNGDGKADLLWQNTSTGEVEVWLMNGITKTSSGSPGTVASPWEVVPAAP